MEHEETRGSRGGMTSAGTSAGNERQFIRLAKGEWCSEMVLWLPWEHKGMAEAMIESDVLTVCSEKFEAVTLCHGRVLDRSREYAREFLHKQLRILEEHGRLWDVAVERIYPDI